MSHTRTRATRVVAPLTMTGLLALASPARAVTRLTDAQAASQLAAAGISRTSSGGCADAYTSTCTSYDQINQSTVSGFITYQRASGCALTITGGTEVGHAGGTYSHVTRLRGDDGYPTYRAASGNDHTNEGSHWDTVYYTCGC